MIDYLRQFLAIVSFSLFPFASLGEVVDPNGPRNTVLSNLSAELGKQGIDVRLGSNSGTSAPSKPQLMPLAQFHSSVTPNVDRSKFADLFIRGVQVESALFAVDNKTGRTYTDPQKFQPRWAGVSSSKRVFVSFSSLDTATAQKVTRAFSAAGYSTFVYTGGSFNAVDTGNYFREAGHRFVVDTASSRSSNAVAVEALMARVRNSGSFPGVLGPGGGVPGGGILGSSQCCKLCNYINGILTSCGPVTCGPQCANAQ